MKFNFLSESDQAYYIHKASTLVEALPYIRTHTGKNFVIKYGGHAMGDQSLAENFSRDVGLLKEVGIDIFILTARHSDAVIRRFKDLGINKIFTKILKKRDFIKEYSKSHNLEKKELAMMGDDLQDLSAINEVGVFFTTPNAIDTVKHSAHYISKKFGGDGAVREICDLIIRSKGSNSSLEFSRYIQEK